MTTITGGEIGVTHPMLLRSPLFDPFEGLLHAFTTRLGGVSPPPFDSLNLSSKTGDAEGNVEKNHHLLESALEIEESLFCLDQVHGNSVLVIEDGGDTDHRPFDAVVTALTGVPLVILTADCLPVLLHDPVKGVIGAVHAGWRGTAGKVTEEAVRRMMDRFGCRAEDIAAAMGPAIGPCCYEVDDAVVDRFRNRYAAENDWRSFAGEVGNGGRGRWMFDLAKANLLQLLRLGVMREKIFLPVHCTCCSKELFFSHRRDGKASGRQGAVIMLR